MSELFQFLTLGWWGYLAPTAVQAALLIVVVAVIDRALPRRTWPELRLVLWLLVMLKLVLPPGLTSPLSLVHTIPDSVSVGLPADLLVMDGGQRAIAGARLIVAAWAAGLVLLVVAGWRRYRRQWRQWKAISDCEAPSWFEPLFENCWRRVRLRRRPEVRFGEQVRTPFVAGLLRPRIFLPRHLDQQLSPRQIEHVLLHELIHLRRLDPWISAACATIQLVYWFHPLVWLAHRRLAEVREQCCDRSVARLLGAESASYRQTLLVCASRLLDDPNAGHLAFVRPTNLLLARLRLLERATPERTWLRRSVTVALLGFLLLVIVPMARGAERVVGEVAELVERPPGCLQLRYLVLRRLAEQEGYRVALPSPTKPSSDTDSPNLEEEPIP